jgi:hypothetical protein
MALALTALTGSLNADVFYLDNGGRIEGVLLNPDESPRQSYQVETSVGARLVLAGDQVDRVVVTSDAQRAYQEFLPTVPDTLEGHWDVAERCRVAGLDEERTYHLQQVLRHDPNHEKARHALGFSLVDGKWTRQEEWLESKGYVGYRGGFRLPQEIQLEEAADEQEMKAVEWRKKIKLWESWVLKGRDRSQEAQLNLRKIRDPWAAPALAEALTRDKKSPPRQLRLLYVDILKELGPNAATKVLVNLALEDNDAAFRDRCLDHLSEWRSAFAVRAFIQALEHDQNAMVHRAAAALGRMQDPTATLPLIEALYTEHKQVVGGGGIRPSFSNQGGSGLSVGGRPKVVKRTVKNQPVLRALTMIHDGVNFGFDQAAWKRWYIEQATPQDVNLRRSD